MMGGFNSIIEKKKNNRVPCIFKLGEVMNNDKQLWLVGWLLMLEWFDILHLPSCIPIVCCTLIICILHDYVILYYTLHVDSDYKVIRTKVLINNNQKELT